MAPTFKSLIKCGEVDCLQGSLDGGSSIESLILSPMKEWIIRQLVGGSSSGSLMKYLVVELSSVSCSLVFRFLQIAAAALNTYAKICNINCPWFCDRLTCDYCDPFRVQPYNYNSRYVLVSKAKEEINSWVSRPNAPLFGGATFRRLHCSGISANEMEVSYWRFN